MTENHPITPPPDKIHNWLQSEKIGCTIEQIITAAAQWGADRQLEADAEWLDQNSLDALHLTITPTGKGLVEAMRPKPPSLKEQALMGLSRIESTGEFFSDGMKDLATIRSALEQLED